MNPQRVVIAAAATAFSVVCEACALEAEDRGWAGTTMTGRLDLDLERGLFLCRRGHEVRVEREPAAQTSRATEAA